MIPPPPLFVPYLKIPRSQISGAQELPMLVVRDMLHAHIQLIIVEQIVDDCQHQSFLLVVSPAMMIKNHHRDFSTQAVHNSAGLIPVILPGVDIPRHQLA